MSKPETTFYTAVNKHLPREVYRVKMNNPYVGGIPDFWYSHAKDMWIEYKFIPRVPQRGAVVPTKLLSALQADWLRERHEEGRSVGVVIGCPTGGVVLPELTWESDLPAVEFTRQILPRKQVAEWILGRIS